MSPSHSNTRNKRYRYYVSQAILQGYRQNAGSIYKVPAEEIENLVKNEITLLVKDKNIMQGHITELDIYRQKEILSNLPQFEITDDFVREILEEVILYSEKVEIVVNTGKLFENIANIEPTGETASIKIIKNIKMTTTSRGGALIVNNGESQTPQINPFLVKVIAKSYYWNKLLNEGKVKSSKNIQKLENMADNSYIKNVLRLRFLSPRITEAILDGRQPADLTVKKLFKVKTLDSLEHEKSLNY